VYAQTQETAAAVEATHNNRITAAIDRYNELLAKLQEAKAKQPIDLDEVARITKDLEAATKDLEAAQSEIVVVAPSLTPENHNQQPIPSQDNEVAPSLTPENHNPRPNSYAPWDIFHDFKKD
jgi:hypothetical protein